jgi:hypothetical protein
MTVGKAAALMAGLVGAFALGIAIGPSVRDVLSVRETHAVVPPAEVVFDKTPAPVATPTPVKPPRARANASMPRAAPSVMIPLSDPRLHDRVKPLLNRGARMALAAEGFRSAEEFATVAHAARNTSVPFMVLKHRVLADGRTLADAIHEAKPEIDAKAEVKRAQAAAKSDMAAIVG